MQVKKQQLKLEAEQQTGSKSGKKYIKAVYCHPAYLTYTQSTSCKMPGWMKAGIKIAETNTNNLRYVVDSTLMAEREEELKRLLMKVKVESEKAVLKLSIQKLRSWHLVHHFMANRWGNNGNSKRLYFGGAPKSLQMVTAAMKLKDTFIPWKKSYDQPRQHI